jgi:transcriptional regulator CtsR
MKTKEIKKNQSLLTELRTIRDKISEELKGKTAEQIIEHLMEKKTLHSKATWQK